MIVGREVQKSPIMAAADLLGEDSAIHASWLVLTIGSCHIVT